MQGKWEHRHCGVSAVRWELAVCVRALHRRVPVLQQQPKHVHEWKCLLIMLEVCGGVCAMLCTTRVQPVQYQQWLLSQRKHTQLPNLQHRWLSHLRLSRSLWRM